MFETKKDVDKHVKTAFSKLNGSEQKTRSLKVAKLYFDVKEYKLAEHYVSAYLSAKPDCPAGNKLLGQIFEKLNKVDNAITAYHKSLELDSKQSDLIKKICSLLLVDEKCAQFTRAKYWCELAESKGVQDTSVLELKLKLADKEKSNPNVVEDLLISEISSNPTDTDLRVRLLNHYINQKKITEAFQCIQQNELKGKVPFKKNINYYNTLAVILNHYRSSNNRYKNEWYYWLLSIITLEKQLQFNLTAEAGNSYSQNVNLGECSRVLFDMDQSLKAVADVINTICQDKEFGEEFLKHNRGQWCLHAAALLFKREILQNEQQWVDTVNNALPLLLLAYQCGKADAQSKWLLHTSSVNKDFIQSWSLEGAFRCAQAGRTILSCMDVHQTETKDDSETSRQEDFLFRVRKVCSGDNWRKTIFRILFNSSDQIPRMSSSNFINCKHLQTPKYELPSISTIETYESIAQHLYPDNLKHLIYLAINTYDLADFRFMLFKDLKFSIADNELSTKYGPKSLNRLDVESFLFAATLQTQRNIDNHRISKSYMNNDTTNDRPKFMPFVNLYHILGSSEQINWWAITFKFCHNQADGKDLANFRSIVQHGIEAVRCIGAQRMDLLMMLHLGNIFKARAENCEKSSDRGFLEARADILYRNAIRLYKTQNTAKVSNIGPKLFVYNSDPDNEQINVILEDAITFVASQYIAKHEYEKIIEELSGIKLPFATYFIAEAYRSLDKSPLKKKPIYSEKARTYLFETQSLLNRHETGRSHPLNGIIQNEIDRYQVAGTNTKNWELSQSINGGHNFYADESLSISRQSLSANDNLQTKLIDMFNGIKIENDAFKQDIRRDVDLLRKDIESFKLDIRRDLDTMKMDLQTKIHGLEEKVSRMVEQQTYATNLMLEMKMRPMDPYMQSYLPYQHPFMNQQIIPQMPYADPMGMGRTAAPDLRATGHTDYLGSPLLTMPTGQMPSNLISINPTIATPPTAINPRTGLGMNQPVISDNTIFQTPKQSTNTATVNKTPNTNGGTLFEQNLQHPAVISTWNATFNNAPVEKGPPVNVVITNSDPLPPQINSQATPAQLSVTIPAHHIKSNTQPAAPKQDASPIKTAAKIGEDVPEPDTISLFSGQAKIFKKDKKNWDVIGEGYLKIMKNTVDNSYHWFCRDYASKKICFDEVINSNMVLNVISNQKKSYSWVNKKNEKYYAAFVNIELANDCKTVFDHIIEDLEKNATKPIPVVNPAPITITPVKEKITTTETVKPSPFSNFSFGLTSSQDGAQPKPFGIGDLISSTPAQPFSFLANALQSTVNKEAPAPLNLSSEDAEPGEFVPTAQFQPVIALPELVEVKTGEENEDILFEHRAKLLRFDTSSENVREWKERGIGNIKILRSKSNVNDVRLVMRREQVLKLCCNQKLTAEMKFTYLPKSKDCALSWYGHDFSEGEVKPDTFAIRFKTADTCKQFLDTILDVQKQLTPGGEVAKVEFAANLHKETGEKPITIDNILSQPLTETKQGFGDKFKAKPGSWNCDGCYLSNDSDTLYCKSCDTPRDKNVPPKKQEPTGLDLSNVKTTFTFGMPPLANATNNEKNAEKSTSVQGFGDAFKPKPGVWNCESCYLSNDGGDIYCKACDAPKDKTVPPKEKKSSGVIDLSNVKTSFTFGMPATTNASAINPAPAVPTFSFGQTTVTPTSGFLFGTASVPASKNSDTDNDAGKPAIEKPTFDFVFKPKSPGKAKSPNVSGISGLENISEDETVEEEENTTYYAPVIPLPDKIEVKTGEEDEDVLYCHRAKLFRFKDSEWKERGLGDVKILKHKTTGKLRVVMRREQILKICLNHVLNNEIEYKRKDPKSWSFVAIDFSEGEQDVNQFSIRFKNEEVAEEFKNAIDIALSNKPVQNGTRSVSEMVKTNDEKSDGEKINISEEDKKLAKKLKLPEEFFLYKIKSDCQGCIGCDPDKFIFENVENPIVKEIVDDNPIPLDMSSIKISSRVTSQPPSTPTTANIFGSVPTTTSSVFSISSFPPPNNTAAFGQSFFGFGTKTSTSDSNTTSIFGKTNNSNNDNSTTNTTFDNSTSSAFNKFGTTTFGATQNTDANNQKSFGSLFGGVSFGNLGKESSETNTTTPTATIFGSNSTKSIFGSDSSFGTTPTPAAAATTTQSSIFGSNTISSFSFSAGLKNIEDNKTTESKPLEGESIFKIDPQLSFETLAKNAGAFEAKTNDAKQGFIGLTNTDDFSRFNNPKYLNETQNGSLNDSTLNQSGDANDDNYDPHYEPIIALPDKIQVSTGEEDEEKVFGERVKLYRYDDTNREWKERGVGEIKLLYHPTNKSYRLLQRREQIYKCVLNHGINKDFSIKPMNNSPKAFMWATLNYAENPEGELEKLAIRFKNPDLASQFNDAITKAIADLSNTSG